MDDILESIEELRWYRENLFIQPKYAVPTPQPIFNPDTTGLGSGSATATDTATGTTGSGGASAATKK